MADLCCQLHCHDSMSFKDGLAPIEKLVERAAELEQPGIGCTNHGHVYSAPRFFRACSKFNIRGVIGMEAYEAVPHTWDPDPSGPHHALFKGKWQEGVHRYYHLTLWVMNQKGWENLCAIHTQSYTKGFKPKNQPLVDRDTLERHNEGLLLGLGCPQSRTNRALEQGFQEGIDAAKWYFDVFGDRVYVEVMAALPEQVRMLADQRKLAKYFGRPTMGVNDVHYLTRDDGVLRGPHHMLVMARKFKSKDTEAAESADRSDDAFGSWYGSDQFYVKTRQEMVQSGIFQAEVDTSLLFLDRVNFDFLAMDEPKPPTARIPDIGVDLDFDHYVLSHS